MHIEKSPIGLRNESFGEVYFNQRKGGMVFLDQNGFITLFKKLSKHILNQNEQDFIRYFFNQKTSDFYKLKLNKLVMVL